MRPMCRRVRSSTFGPFWCVLGRRICSVAFSPFPCALGFVRVSSVYSRAPWVSSGSFVCVQSIPARLGGRRGRSGPFGAPLDSYGCSRSISVGPGVLSCCVRFIPVLPSGRRFLSSTFVPFPCAMWVVGFVRVLPAHCRACWVVVRCIRLSILMRSGDGRVLSGAFGPFPCAQRVVGFNRVRSVHSRTPWTSPGSFSPLLSSLGGGVGFVRVSLVHSSAPWGSFGCLRSISVRPWYRRVRLVHFRAFVLVRSVHSRPPLGLFGPFPCALEIYGFVVVHSRAPFVFVRVRSVHSRAPWWWSGSLGSVRPIPVRHGVGSGAFGPFPCVRHGDRLFLS